MAKGLNNFSDPEIIADAAYKLYVVLKPEFASKYPKNPLVYFSQRTARNNGLERLYRLANLKKKEANLMIIYDNQTGQKYQDKVLYLDPNYIPLQKS
jgi:hypothetical protein